MPINLSAAPQQGQQAFNTLSGQQAAQQSPQIQALLAQIRSGNISLADAIKQAQGLPNQSDAERIAAYNAAVQQKLAEARAGKATTTTQGLQTTTAQSGGKNEQASGPIGTYGGGLPAAGDALTQDEINKLTDGLAKSGQFGPGFDTLLSQTLAGKAPSDYKSDTVGELQKAAAIDPILGNQMAAEAVQKNPLFQGYFGRDNSLQAQSLQKQSLLDSQYAGATGQLGGLQDRASEAYKYVQSLQDQYQQDRQKLDPAQQLVDQRNQQLTSDRSLLGEDRSNLSSWNTALQGAMNNLKGLNEAGTAADAMYGYQASDYDALARAQDSIARQAGAQENQLAASLAARGLGAGPSGAAAQLFSGAQGNKFEQLAASQQQIAQQRIQNAMQLSQARAQAAQGGLGEANKTYGTTVNLLGTDTGAVNAANQGMSNVVNLLGQGTNAIQAGNQTYGQANTGIGLGLQAQQNALNAVQGNQGFLTSLGNLGLQAQGQQYNTQVGGTETGYNQLMGINQAGQGMTAQENQFKLGQASLDQAKEQADKNLALGVLGSAINLGGKVAAGGAK